MVKLWYLRSSLVEGAHPDTCGQITVFRTEWHCTSCAAKATQPWIGRGGGGGKEVLHNCCLAQIKCQGQGSEGQEEASDADGRVIAGCHGDRCQVQPNQRDPELCVLGVGV